MTIHNWRVLHMANLREKIQEQEPVVDSWLTRLEQSQHTAEIIAIAAAFALGVGIVAWLVA